MQKTLSRDSSLITHTVGTRGAVFIYSRSRAQAAPFANTTYVRTGIDLSIFIFVCVFFFLLVLLFPPPHSPLPSFASRRSPVSARQLCLQKEDKLFLIVSCQLENVDPQIRRSGAHVRLAMIGPAFGGGIFVLALSKRGSRHLLEINARTVFLSRLEYWIYKLKLRAGVREQQQHLANSMYHGRMLVPSAWRGV